MYYFIRGLLYAISARDEIQLETIISASRPTLWQYASQWVSIPGQYVSRASQLPVIFYNF